MKASLTKGLDKDAKQRMEADFTSALHLRERLAELLEADKNAKINVALSDKEFDSPSWAHKQAYNMGYAAAIKQALSLLS